MEIKRKIEKKIIVVITMLGITLFLLLGIVMFYIVYSSNSNLNPSLGYKENCLRPIANQHCMEMNLGLYGLTAHNGYYTCTESFSCKPANRGDADCFSMHDFSKGEIIKCTK